MVAGSAAAWGSAGSGASPVDPSAQMPTTSLGQANSATSPGQRAFMRHCLSGQFPSTLILIWDSAYVQ